MHHLMLFVDALKKTGYLNWWLESKLLRTLDADVNKDLRQD